MTAWQAVQEAIKRWGSRGEIWENHIDVLPYHVGLSSTPAPISLGADSSWEAAFKMADKGEKMDEVVTVKKWLPLVNHSAIFTPRKFMRRSRIPLDWAKLPVATTVRGLTSVPLTTLPVDSTGKGTVVCPMDGNDTYGNCGEAMVDHSDRIRQWRNGKGVTWPDTTPALEQQYFAISGGDNGMDEDMVVGPQGAWTVGIGGNVEAIAFDHLDIDPADVALTQYAIDQFYTVEMAWSVPDDFINGFAPGSVWPSAMTPDPNNGHYTPLASIHGPGEVVNGQDINGFYELYTWGGYVYAGPAFIASVQPQFFTTFSPRQFDPKTGLDGKGRHVTTQGAKWVTIGGNQEAVTKTIAMFPPAGPSSDHPIPAGGGGGGTHATAPRVLPADVLADLEVFWASIEALFGSNPVGKDPVAQDRAKVVAKTKYDALCAKLREEKK